MNPESPQQPIPILNTAWQRFAELNVNAQALNRQHLRLRKWVAALGVIATLLAIVINVYGDTIESYTALGAFVMRFMLVLTPIIGSVIAAVVNKFYGGGGWLTMRAGAEEILKEIYIYRTILQSNLARRRYLSNRLVAIQRQVYKGLGGELALKPYKGKIPPYYEQGSEYSDPGFQDLTGEEYLKFRLEDQLAWHIKKVQVYQKERTRLQWLVLGLGGAGAVLAGIGGGNWAVWVALTASLAAAFSGWSELRNLDAAVRNYSKVILELNILRDNWQNLEPEERTTGEFFSMVRATEDILWSQNIEYIRAMQDALAAAENEDAQLVEQMVRNSREADANFKRQLRENTVGNAREQMDSVYGNAAEEHRRTLGTLDEEFQSGAVQQEVAIVADAAKNAASQVLASLDSLKDRVQQEFADVHPSKETDKGTLNAILSRFPAQGEGHG